MEAKSEAMPAVNKPEPVWTTGLLLKYDVGSICDLSLCRRHGSYSVRRLVFVCVHVCTLMHTCALREQQEAFMGVMPDIFSVEGQEGYLFWKPWTMASLACPTPFPQSGSLWV